METLIALAAFAVLVLPVAALLLTLFTNRRLANLEEALRTRIEQLEWEVGRLRKGLPGEIPDPVPAPSPPKPMPPPAPAPAPAAAPRTAEAPPAAPPPPEESLETRIGGRWATWVGIVAIVTAVGLLLRWSFERGLIGPAARVITGLVSGVALVAAGLVLRKREDLPYLAPGLAGGGLAILYLSVWAAHQAYGFLDAPRAFAALVAVTLLGIAVSLAASSQATAILAVLGGLATPILVSTDRPDERVLFVYLIVLGGLVLGVARRRSWPALTRLAWLGSVLLGIPILVQRPAAEEPAVRLALLTALFALYLAAPVARSWMERSRAEALDLALVVGNAMAYCAAAYVIFERWRPGLEGPWAIAAALLYVAVGEVHRRRVPEDLPTALVHHGAAVVLLGLAVPLVLDGAWITLGWALEGAVLLALAPLVPSGLAAFWGGFLALAGAAARVAFVDPSIDPARTPVWNSIFASDLATVAVLLAAGRIVSRLDPTRFGLAATGADLRGVFRFAAVGLLAVLFWREPTGLWPGVLLVGLLLATAGIARANRDRALVAILPLLALLVAARVFVPGAGPAWDATDRFLSPPALLRIGACLAMMAAAWLLRREDATNAEGIAHTALGALGGVGLLGALSLAWADPLRHAAAEARQAVNEDLATALSRRLQTGLSILWTLYAAAVLAVGFARRAEVLRWGALALFGLVVAKVFLVDLSDLPGIYRVVSFLVLGIVLLAVATVYQRLARKRPPR